jgi:glycosyltransferase involved in cell wall biosynthesis
MSDKPRVTVVIPTFNRAAFVVEAVDSVLRQSYQDFEVVVCDDGSTDDTAACIETYGPPVRYLRLEHTGCPGAPRNRGIDAARGELVAFLDDDDLWEPAKLALQVELLDKESADLVYSDRRVEFEAGVPPEIIISPSPQGRERWLDLVLQGHFPSVCTALMRRSLLQLAGGFDEDLVTGEDLDLWLRLGSVARTVRVPEPLVIVRRRPGTLSDRSGRLTYRNAIEVLERSFERDDLCASQRRTCRATQARLNLRLASLLADAGERRAALRAVLQALRYAPANRAVWAALARMLRQAGQDMAVRSRRRNGAQHGL